MVKRVMTTCQNRDDLGTNYSLGTNQDLRSFTSNNRFSTLDSIQSMFSEKQNSKIGYTHQRETT